MTTKEFVKRAFLGVYLSVTLGTVSAQLYNPHNLPPVISNQKTIVVKSADLDNDGDLDLVLGNEFETNTVFFNNGLGEFTIASDLFSSEPKDTDDIGIADFDQDGDQDIIFVNQGGFGHEYYINNGDGTFAEGSTLPFTNGNAIAVADLNNDGYPDIVLGNLFEQNFCLINDGTGNFINDTPARLPFGTDGTQDLKFGDLDNDGDLDLFVANQDKNRLLINIGNGVFADFSNQRLPQNADMDSQKAALADVNNDGLLDIFLANVQFLDDKDPQNRLYLNTGNAFFVDATSTHLPLILDQSTNVVFHDFDENGSPDLFITNVLHSPLLAYQNQGDGTFVNRTEDVIADLGMVEEIWGLVVEDLNNDDLRDIYISSRTGMDAYFVGDPEGMIITSTPTTEDLGYGLSCFPNPVEEVLFVQCPEGNSITPNFTIYNSQGQQLVIPSVTSRTDHRFELAIPVTLPTGIYFLMMENDKESRVMRFYKK